ncbi:MAG: CHASE3 domain-containing protein, partial [Thermoanaerobaculia bacterium]
MSFRGRLAAAFVAAMLVVAVIVIVSYRSTRVFIAADRMLAHTHEVISTLEETRSFVVSAETNQRAYVITGQEQYADRVIALRPLLEQRLDQLHGLVADPGQIAREQRLRQSIQRKLAMVDHIIRIRRERGFEAAREVVLSGDPMREMDEVNAIIGSMRANEHQLLIDRAQRSETQALRTVLLLTLGGAMDLLLLMVVFYLVDRDHRRGRQLRQALSSARDAAIRAAEMKSAFLANMSHEIRTPMNAVIGMTGVLLGTDLNADQRELAQTVRTSADSLLTIINDIRDLSKIEAGKLLIERSDFDLRQTVESAVELLSEGAHSKGLDIGVLFDSTIP